MSIRHSGAALRVACAEARAIYLGVAAGRWNVPPGVLTVRDGTIAVPNPPLSPAHRRHLRGDVLSWQHEIWGNGHVTRPGFARTIGLLEASHRDGGEPIEAAAEPPLERGGGAGRNAVPGYPFPAYRVVNHRLSVMPLRTSSLRSLGGFVNVFAIESFMDELAVAAGRDLVEYRLAQLADPGAGR
jgi:CO/xanthine dehydrogenase Mo-binding subunit